MYLLGFLFIFICAQKAFATELCIATTPCKCVMNGGQVIDLTSVGQTTQPRFKEILANENSSGLYSYNPCYSFDSPDPYTKLKEGNKPCKNAAGCARYPGSSTGEAPEEHAIGIQNTYKFESFGESIYISYSVPDAKQSLSVRLKCDNETKLHTLSIDVPESDLDLRVNMTLTSKCACVNGCASPVEPEKKSGLSTGSKLLITFFTIAIAYFIVGMVYNFCNGAQGVELVPNLDFWNELPKLIIEGVAFSTSCCVRKSNYGEV